MVFPKRIFPLLLIYFVLFPSVKLDLTIHLIAHSHMDPGWIKTDQEFFNQDVYPIYDTVYNAMIEKPERKFVFAEIINFKRWYESKNEEIKSNVKEMVKNGRIEIVGGGYVMNDEATPHYQDIIDQMRFGMKYCMNEFGVLSNTQWTIDPFGHSAAHALLMSQLGFKQIVVNRIHYQEFKERLNSGRLQFIYQPFNNELGKKILYHIIPYHYGQGQCDFCASDSMPPSGDSYSIERSANNMLDRLNRIRKAYTNRDIIMHLMGDDFTYKYKNRFVRNELIMNYINTHKYHGETVKIFYSTPREYFNAIYEDNDLSKKQIPLEGNIDFFPYADMRYAYWTGYFTSRPYLKGIIRKTSNFLYSNSMLLAEMKLNYRNQEIDFLNDLRGVSAHMQHHDAVTGTSKERVSKDFITMCRREIDNSKKKMTVSLDSTFFGYIGGKQVKICLNNGIVDLGCELLNELEFKEDEAVISVYNPQNEGKLLISLEFNRFDYQYTIFKEDKEIPSDFYCIHKLETDYHNKCFLNFFYEFNPSISFYYFKLKRSDQVDINYEFFPETNQTLIEDDSIIDKLDYNPKNNSFILSLKESKEEYSFALDYVDIPGHRSHATIPNEHSDPQDDDDRYAWPAQSRPFSYNGDGAYIFSPDMKSIGEPSLIPGQSRIFKGKIGITLFLRYERFGYMILTFYKDPFFLKVDHILDKSLQNLRHGSNLIFRLRSDINNNLKFEDNEDRTEFWTDSNGFNMIRRVRDLYLNYKNNHEENVSNNYYPITSCISIRERKDKQFNKKEYFNLDSTDRSISIFNDKSQSGSSMNPGEITLLIQRSSFTDDSRGVAENLREDNSDSINFKSSHFIIFGSNINFSKETKAENFVYNYMHNSVILASKNLMSEREDIKSSLNKLFTIHGKNVRQNVEIVNDKLIIVQFYNHYDYYFEGIGGSSTASVEINPENVKDIIVMTDFNGLKYISVKGNDLIKFLISKKSKVIIGPNDITYFYLYFN
ncbi:MAG: hypothetical protein MJ252_08725 [archaeon]|nr:hypothetical protein [archaeon]